MVLFWVVNDKLYYIDGDTCDTTDYHNIIDYSYPMIITLGVWLIHDHTIGYLLITSGVVYYLYLILIPIK